MQKRIKFKCWNCEREYSLLRELEGQPKLFVACPFCEAEGVVDLAPYRSEVVEIYKSAANDAQFVGAGLILPAVLPTVNKEEAAD